MGRAGCFPVSSWTTWWPSEAGGRAGLAKRSLLCLPGCSSPTPTGSQGGSEISYLLRSQILRGEKCPQQAVPVTKELPNKRRAESGRACQNLRWKGQHNCKCSACSPGIIVRRQDERRGGGASEKLREDSWEHREVCNPQGPHRCKDSGTCYSEGSHQKTPSLDVQPSGQGRAGL